MYKIYHYRFYLIPLYNIKYVYRNILYLNFKRSRNKD